jgi:group II intron reverse transcriptase/maturase
MSEAKPYEIGKVEVWEAYKRVKANRGAAGVDKQSLEEFEANLRDNLYKIWNRMSSGSYLPPPVRRVEIPKKGGGIRPLGVPTVADRIAQTVVAKRIEEKVESHFHPDSYAYRPNKSALDAVGKARERCWRFSWVIDLDLQAFFDSLDWDLLMRAVGVHVKEAWMLLYIKRWLQAPAVGKDGMEQPRCSGSPQGGVVSPVLANLFLHYAFDTWMQRNYPQVPFERYADDIVIHCGSKEQAEQVLEAVRQRLKECRLELNEQKTQIVYCRDSNRKEKYEQVCFDFLGYTFMPRRAQGRDGRRFWSFLPAISNEATSRIRRTVRGWHLPSQAQKTLEELAPTIDPYVRGWMNYYGRYCRSECVQALRYINLELAKWARKKYKHLRKHDRRSEHYLGRLARRRPDLLALWTLGVKPPIEEART